MEDVECPYCGKPLDIDHDDGYGYEENEIYEQDCWNCKKTFAYVTEISFWHTAHKAPCMNEGEHDLKDIHRYPKDFAVGRKICENCGEEIVVDKEASDKAKESYRLKHNPTAKGGF